MLEAVRASIAMSKNMGEKKVPFCIHSAPPDGLCCYHCVLAAMNLNEWLAIARHPSGFAKNPRTVKTEGASAAALRQLALDSTDQTNQRMVELSNEAGQYLSLDINELSWLGHTMDLAIRCVIDDKAVVGEYSNCIQNSKIQYSTVLRLLHYRNILNNTGQ